MFSWIRAKVKNAILAGFNDAIEHLERTAGEVPDDPARLLAERTALPEPQVIEAKVKMARVKS